MKRKCQSCGKLVDTDQDEYLTTASGVLCIDCANDDQSYDNSDSDTLQTLF